MTETEEHRAALRVLWACLGGSAGYHAIEYTEHGKRFYAWAAVQDWDWFVKIVEPLLWESEPRISPAPYVHRGGFRLRAEVGCLWARCETGKHVAALERFKPQPTLIVQEGQSARRTALWALRKPLLPDQAERANKRIAYKLRTVQARGECSFMFFLPGTIVRSDRKRPCPVWLSGGTGELAPPVRRWVGGLKDPPEPDPTRWSSNGKPKPAAVDAQLPLGP